MLCAISGEVPQDPVVSSKSGNVFERRLIEAKITENGKDPVTNEDLTVEDLISLKTSRVVRPRPPTLTSIPSLLSVFQNEWDALALESYNVRQQLSQTRQELATALYQHDAAVRVIARLTRERDEARDALSKVTVNVGGASNGEMMQIDGMGLPEELLEKVDETHERLSKGRRKRAVPRDWATSDEIESYHLVSTSQPLDPGSSSVAIDNSGERVIVGGLDGNAAVCSLLENKIVQVLNIDGGVSTDVAWAGSRPVVSSSSGAVKVFDDGNQIASLNSHAGAANAIALHPSGEILASVGVDKSFVFHDLINLRPVIQIYADCALTTAAFHPDGQLFAAGGTDGQIKLYHVKTGEFAAGFDCSGPIQAISFSENGFWFAAATKDSTSVTVFDLRKQGEAAQVKIIDIGGRVDCICWDYTGQFLATAGPSGITVQHYTKSSKTWSEPLRSAAPTTALEWGDQARSLVSVNTDGVIAVLRAK